MHKLEYLPMARQDMTEIARYISHDLSSPSPFLSTPARQKSLANSRRAGV
jgi:hypothetical protein